MTTESALPPEQIATRILVLRGHRVLLDADLAALYAVTTKRLNEQVKRNAERFPPDFAFRLLPSEVEALNRSQIATGRQKHRDPRFPPNAFTEHGALMAAAVLNTIAAVQVSLQVVRAFVRIRQLLATNEDLARRVALLERKAVAHETSLRALSDAFRDAFQATPPAPKRRIGFGAEPAARSGEGSPTESKPDRRARGRGRKHRPL